MNGLSPNEAVLLKAGALQRAIFNSENFSFIATDASGVIQIFNVGAERMLGYRAAEVVNQVTPAQISDPAELIARALSAELSTHISPGFEALILRITPPPASPRPPPHPSPPGQAMRLIRRTPPARTYASPPRRNPPRKS